MANDPFSKAMQEQGMPAGEDTFSKYLNAPEPEPAGDTFSRYLQPEEKPLPTPEEGREFFKIKEEIGAVPGVPGSGQYPSELQQPTPPEIQDKGLRPFEKALYGDMSAATFEPLETLKKVPEGGVLQTLGGLGGLAERFNVDPLGLRKYEELAETLQTARDPDAGFWRKAWANAKLFNPLNASNALMDLIGLQSGAAQGQQQLLEESGVGPVIREYGNLLASGAEEELKELTENMSVWDQMLFSAGTSVEQFGIDSIIGLGFKSLTGAPLKYSVPAQFGLKEYGRAFHEGLERTGSISKALRHAEYSGVLEAGTEYLPAVKLFEVGTPVFKRLLGVLSREVPGENIAELGQRLSEFVNGLEGEMTGQEVIDKFLDEAPSIMFLTTGATVMGSSAMSGIVNAAQKTAQAVDNFEKRLRSGKEITAGLAEVDERMNELILKMAESSETMEEFQNAMKLLGDSIPESQPGDPDYMKDLIDQGKYGYGGMQSSQLMDESMGLNTDYDTGQRWANAPSGEGETRFVGTNWQGLYEGAIARRDAAQQAMDLWFEENPTSTAPNPYLEAVQEAEESIIKNRKRAVLAEHLQQRIKPLIQDWVERFSPGIGVIITDGTEQEMGSALGNMTVLSDNANVKRLALNLENIADRLTASGDLTEDLLANPGNQKIVRHASEIVAHEFGHALMIDALFKGPDYIREGMFKAYIAQLRELDKSKNAREALRKRRGVFAKLYWDQYTGKDESFGDHILKQSLSRGSGSFPTFFDYHYSFQEFLAHEMERTFSGTKQGASDIKRYWKRVGAILERFHRRVKGAYEPTQSYTKFLEYMQAKAVRDEAARMTSALGLTKDLVQGESATVKKVELIRKALETTEGYKKLGQPKEIVANLDHPNVPPAAVDPANTGVPMSERNDLDKYGNFIRKYGYTLTQLQWDNPHIKGLQSYMKAVQNWWSEKTKWNVLADDTLKEWSNLGSKQADALSRFLLDVTLESDKKRRKLSTKELGEFHDAGKYNLSERAQALFQQIDRDMQAALGYDPVNPQGLYRILIKDINRKWAQQPTERARQIETLNRDMRKLADRNFFPLNRFGKYTVTVRALQNASYGGRPYKIGEIISFETYANEKEQKAAAAKRRIDFPQHRVDVDMLLDEEQALLSLPQTLLDKMETQLGLDEDQMQKLKEVSLKMTPAQQFKKHLLERKGTPGFSMDAMRGYAAYFMHFSNAIARMEYGPQMEAAITDIGESITRIKAEGGNPVQRRKIMQHLLDHKEYIMNPGNELASLRGFGFLWYLGALPKSAWVNLTQVPMIALPYLAGRKELGGGALIGANIGGTRAASAIAKAMTDVSRMYATGKGITQQEQLMMEELRRRGTIDESLATELAGIAEGSTLTPLLPGGRLKGRKAVKTLRAVNKVGTFLFHSAEKFNRRITALAAYRLARRNGIDHDNAMDEAQRAVDKTQYEYARWNRPRFMRGKASVIFLFFQYLQQTLHFLVKDPANARALITLVALAGIQGLPGFEDIADILDKLMNWYNKKWGKSGEYFNVREEIRNLASEMSVNPDVLMHGLGREYGLGPFHALEFMGIPVPNTDISSSISLGRIVPGLEEALKGEQLTGGLASGLAGAGGAVVNIPLQMWDAVASNDPDTWKRFERALPSVLKNISKAGRLYVRGEETDRSKAVVAEFDRQDPLHIAELVAQAGGFRPTRVAERQEFNYAQRQAEKFYQARRTSLMEQYGNAILANDKEGMQATLRAINRFNSTLPYKELSIGAGMKNSVKQRFKTKMLRDAGINPDKNFFRMQEDREELFNVTEEPVK